MLKSISVWQTAGFFAASLIGTLFHFTYAFSGQNIMVALFSAVNESVWEHMKLVFFPLILFAILEYWFWGKQQKNFWNVKLLGITLGILLNIVIYYTISGAFGTAPLWVDVSVFYITLAVVFFVETRLFKKEYKPRLPSTTAVLLIALLAILFAVLTLIPPELPLFTDYAGNTGLPVRLEKI